MHAAALAKAAMVDRMTQLENELSRAQEAVSPPRASVGTRADMMPMLRDETPLSRSREAELSRSQETVSRSPAPLTGGSEALTGGSEALTGSPRADMRPLLRNETVKRATPRRLQEPAPSPQASRGEWGTPRTGAHSHNLDDLEPPQPAQRACQCVDPGEECTIM